MTSRQSGPQISRVFGPAQLPRSSPLHVPLLTLISHFPKLCPHIYQYHVKQVSLGDPPTQCLTCLHLDVGVWCPLCSPRTWLCAQISQPHLDDFSVCVNSNLWSSRHCSPKGKKVSLSSKAKTERLFQRITGSHSCFEHWIYKIYCLSLLLQCLWILFFWWEERKRLSSKELKVHLIFITKITGTTKPRIWTK